MRDIFSLESTTTILPDDSYVSSYPYLVEYFSSKSLLDAADVVRGAHMVYGWMPTVLELYPENWKGDLDNAADILTKAKDGLVSGKDIEKLSSLVNNSLVGATKLLHFVSPERFPIWDSKVYSFVHEERPHHYRVNNVETYEKYIILLKSLEMDSRFPSFYQSVISKLGYEVSSLRSLELIMFLNAPVYGG